MSVSKSYASALLAAVQAERFDAAAIDKIEADLKGFASDFASHAQLRAAICGPATTPAEKGAILTQLATKCQWHPMVLKFLDLVSRKGRMDLASELANAFARERIEAAGGMLGVLESSDPLSDSDVKQLAAAFSQKLGKQVAFEKKTRPELLAGVKVTVGGTTYDGTLKAQLNRLRDKFFETSSSTH
jgi:F-type H+-transporting ATPase subunit delta